MQTNTTLAVALAVTAAVAVGAVGYIAGTQRAPSAPTATPAAPGPAPAVSQADVEAMVRQAIAARLKATPADGAAVAPVELSVDERLEVQAIIKNYLIANPEIIRDAINALQLREDAAARATQVAAISANAALLFESNREVVFGNPKGEVTLVEFFDYNCTYCRVAHQDMIDMIAKDPTLRVVLKQFPVLGNGSVQAAQVAVGVHLVAPEKYFAFHDALLHEKGQVDGERALAIAGEVGIDPEVVRAKLSDEEIQNTINESYDLAGKLALTGTPSYVTRKEVVVGAVGSATLLSRIEDARNCVKAATC